MFFSPNLYFANWMSRVQHEGGVWRNEEMKNALWLILLPFTYWCCRFFESVRNRQFPIFGLHTVCSLWPDNDMKPLHINLRWFDINQYLAKLWLKALAAALDSWYEHWRVGKLRQTQHARVYTRKVLWKIDINNLLGSVSVSLLQHLQLQSKATSCDTLCLHADGSKQSHLVAKRVSKLSAVA